MSALSILAWLLGTVAYIGVVLALWIEERRPLNESVWWPIPMLISLLKGLYRVLFITWR